jgi:branched-chain amino acid transport system permease protein
MSDPGSAWGRRLAAPIAIAGLLALAWWPQGYWLYQASLLMASMIALMGMVLLTGLAGQVSLGQGAFVALGAYIAAAMMQASLPIPDALGLVVAPIVGFCLGWMLGYPALRLSGHLLALATFALAIAVPQLLKLPLLSSWTGGAQGRVLERSPPPPWVEALGMSAGQDAWLYLVCLGSTIVVTVLTLRLQRGPLGRAWAAARDHPIAAQSLGVRLARVRSLAFALSAACAALAGVLQAWASGFVSPDSFPVFLSISLLVGLVIGGVRSVWGVVIGAVFIHSIPGMAAEWSPDMPWVIYGVLLIGVVGLMPEGIAPRIELWLGAAIHLCRERFKIRGND